MYDKIYSALETLAQSMDDLSFLTNMFQLREVLNCPECVEKLSSPAVCPECVQISIPDSSDYIILTETIGNKNVSYRIFFSDNENALDFRFLCTKEDHDTWLKKTSTFKVSVPADCMAQNIFDMFESHLYPLYFNDIEKYPLKFFT